MTTLDELQQQLAALSARVDALTTPPDDYYTSKYSGEEIDAGIAKTVSLPESWPLPITSGGTSADSAQLALAKLGGRPNENLLDNWYFVGGGSQGNRSYFPVNQRGNTQYFGQAQTSIDRWILQYETNLELLPDCIRLSKSWGMWQVLPLSAGTYTFSVLIANRSGTVRIYANSDDNTEYGMKYIDGSDSDGIYSTTFPLPENSANAKVSISFTGGQNQVDIKAAKLERGDKQTLGWKDDAGIHLFETHNFGEELARCQRYGIPVFGGRYVGNNLGNRVIVFIPTPVTMRTTPVIQVSNYGRLVFSSGETKIPTSIEVEGVDSNGIKCACYYDGAVSGALAQLGDLMAYISADP